MNDKESVAIGSVKSRRIRIDKPPDDMIQKVNGCIREGRGSQKNNAIKKKSGHL